MKYLKETEKERMPLFFVRGTAQLGKCLLLSVIPLLVALLFVLSCSLAVRQDVLINLLNLSRGIKFLGRYYCQKAYLQVDILSER